MGIPSFPSPVKEYCPTSLGSLKLRLRSCLGVAQRRPVHKDEREPSDAFSRDPVTHPVSTITLSSCTKVLIHDDVK